MKCLNCNEEMMNNLVMTKKQAISYEVCEACGSLWLDASELDKMAFQVDGSIEVCSKDEAKHISGPAKKCPRCEDTVLDKVFFLKHSDVILEHCGNCGGFWLDGGELDLVNRELHKILPIKGAGFAEFVNNVHVPYWHKRMRRKSSEVESAPAVDPFKDAELKSETECKCPACRSNLDLYRVYGIEVERCRSCQGIWLDRDELRKLKDKSEQDSWSSLRWMDDEIEAIGRTNATPSKRRCPKCETENLVSTSFGDSLVMIDWCPSCQGTWLDRDEFQEIVGHLRTKLNELSSAEVRSKVYQEIKEIWSGSESKISEILDAKAAIGALVNLTIFHHPKLCELLLEFQKAARGAGL